VSIKYAVGFYTICAVILVLSGCYAGGVISDEGVAKTTSGDGSSDSATVEGEEEEEEEAEDTECETIADDFSDPTTVNASNACWDADDDLLSFLTLSDGQISFSFESSDTTDNDPWFLSKNDSGNRAYQLTIQSASAANHPSAQQRVGLFLADGGVSLPNNNDVGLYVSENNNPSTPSMEVRAFHEGSSTDVRINVNSGDFPIVLRVERSGDGNSLITSYKREGAGDTSFTALFDMAREGGVDLIFIAIVWRRDSGIGGTFTGIIDDFTRE
jgi:hypothetical protein